MRFCVDNNKVRNYFCVGVTMEALWTHRQWVNVDEELLYMGRWMTTCVGELKKKKKRKMAIGMKRP